MNILEALDDPALFAGMFDGPSWRPWRAFLAALFGLPMDDEALATYRHHTGRLEPPAAAFREACLVCGRRGGKSRTLGLIATFLATVPDFTEHTAPGEVPVVAVIAADRKQARVIFSYIAGLLRAAPALAPMVEDQLAETIRLSNGVAIEIHTSSIGAPRGRTFIAVCADECAFWDTGDAANPDKEVIAAVRPGLATLPNSMLLIASSPYARRGVLFDTFSRYFGKDGAPVLVWRGTTQEMNSRIDPRIIEEAFEADPESAEAEYNANFRTDITAFIGRDAVEAVVADGLLEVPPAAGVSYAGFVDPSGGSADSMTLAVAHMAQDGTAVLDAVRERKPPFSPEDVTAEFSDLLRNYGITRVCGDAYAGEWPRERFAAHGIGYEVSARNKNAIYQDFLPALNGRRVRLLDHPRLIGQLCNLERRVSRGGRDSIDHGPGQHDDVANSVCGALTLVINDRRPALVRQHELLNDDKPVQPAGVRAILGALWATPDGMCAWVLFAYSILHGESLVLLDYSVQPWEFSILREVARRMDEECETALAHNPRARSSGLGIAAVLLAPEQLVAPASAEVAQVFSAHAHRYDWGKRRVGVDPIEQIYITDLSRTLLQASVCVGQGRVKLSPEAFEKTQGVPLLASLTPKAGDPLDADPLRVALLVVIAGLEPLPDHHAPLIPSARLTFG